MASGRPSRTCVCDMCSSNLLVLMSCELSARSVECVQSAESWHALLDIQKEPRNKSIPCEKARNLWKRAKQMSDDHIDIICIGLHGSLSRQG